MFLLFPHTLLDLLHAKYENQLSVPGLIASHPLLDLRRSTIKPPVVPKPEKQILFPDLIAPHPPLDLLRSTISLTRKERSCTRIECRHPSFFCGSRCCGSRCCGSRCCGSRCCGSRCRCRCRCLCVSLSLSLSLARGICLRRR